VTASRRRPHRVEARKRRKKNSDNKSWKIVCDPERFQKLRHDVGFHRLLDLARHSNALRYAIAAVYDVGDANTPWAARQRSATFFYHGGILYEALKLIPRLRPHFQHLPGWQSGFGKFGSDEAILKRLRKGGDMHILRNHTSFHVLEMVASQSLKTLTMPEYVFSTGRGKRGGEVYHNLADTVALHYVIGSPREGAQFTKEFKRIAIEMRDLAIEYLAASDRLLGAALPTMGFTVSGDPPL
jgi:hypothetical protein